MIKETQFKEPRTEPIYRTRTGRVGDVEIHPGDIISTRVASNVQNRRVNWVSDLGIPVTVLGPIYVPAGYEVSVKCPH